MDDVDVNTYYIVIFFGRAKNKLALKYSSKPKDFAS